jgi:hypothetical protein
MAGLSIGVFLGGELIRKFMCGRLESSANGLEWGLAGQMDSSSAVMKTSLHMLDTPD